MLGSSTLVIAVDVDIFGGEWEVIGVLDDVFIELIVEEGMGVLLPGDCFEGEDVFVGEFLVACCH